ncbi:MAG: lipopolysaccharide kinase InaA family protein [Desulfovermiculus sp.]
MTAKLQAHAARCPSKTPFVLHIESEHEQIQVLCRQVLRYLPGKRLVCDGEWAGKRVIVKLFLSARKGNRHCAREEQGLSALQRAGLDSPRLLFKGAAGSQKQPAMILSYIQEGVDCKHLWDKAEDEKEREDILLQLGRAISDLHEAGLYHQDMHLGNFMAAGKRVYILDGAALVSRREGSPLAQTKSIKNLAMFFAQFSLQDDHLFPQALREYAQKRGWTVDKELSDQLAKHISRERRKRERAYLKKIFRDSTAYACRKSLTTFWVCRRVDFSDQMTDLLKDPDRAMHSGWMLKEGNSSTVALIEVDDRQLVVKRYNMKNFVHRLKRSLRPSRAWKSWRNAHILSQIGIKTPMPVALVEKRLGPLRSTAYYITEFVPGKSVYTSVYSKDADQALKQKIVDQLRELLDRFQRAFIVHGDMKATNFIVADEQIMVTDLDAMKRYTRAGKKFTRGHRKDWERFQKNWNQV